MSAPPFTPMEANAHGAGVLQGWSIEMEGPAMSPPSYWFHVAISSEGVVFYPTGDTIDPIDETTEWSPWPQ